MTNRSSDDTVYLVQFCTSQKCSYLSTNAKKDSENQKKTKKSIPIPTGFAIPVHSPRLCAFLFPKQATKLKDHVSPDVRELISAWRQKYAGNTLFRARNPGNITFSSYKIPSYLEKVSSARDCAMTPMSEELSQDCFGIFSSRKKKTSETMTDSSSQTTNGLEQRSSSLGLLDDIHGLFSTEDEDTDANTSTRTSANTKTSMITSMSTNTSKRKRTTRPEDEDVKFNDHKEQTNPSVLFCCEQVVSRHSLFAFKNPALNSIHSSSENENTLFTSSQKK